MKEQALKDLRMKIDALDEKIQALIATRADLAAEVAKVKKETNTQSVFYRPEREAQVLSRVIKRNKSLLKDKDVGHIFREIMSACLALSSLSKLHF